MPLPTGQRFDLHLHTDRSDGRFGPEEVVARCIEGGLDVIAITDHDIASRLDPGEHVDGSRRVHVLAGAEVSGFHDGHEFHLLVYFPKAVPVGFRDFCDARARERLHRYEAALATLSLPGLPAPDDTARAGDRTLTRHHLARALVAAGHAKSVRDAFDRFTGDALGNVRPIEYPFLDAIRVARDFGGVTSWAHPPRNAVERYLPTFVAAGLQGIEAHRPQLPRDLVAFYRATTRRFNLLSTGGSDWHGWRAAERPGLFQVQRRQLDDFLAALALAA